MPTFYPPGKRYPPGDRRRNAAWVVRGHVDGRQYEFATTALHKKGRGGAEEQWDAFRARIRAERGQPVTAQTATFAHAVALYRRHRALSPNEAAFVARLAAELGARRLAELTRADLAEAAHRLYPGRLPQTKNRQALRPAAAVLHAAHDAGLMPWLRVKLLRETAPARPIAYPEDLAALIRAARRARDRPLAALLVTLQYQGWRIGEILKLERARVDWPRGRVERWVAKQRAWRSAGVAPRVLAAWRGLAERADGRLFPWPDRHAVYRALDRLGVALPDGARFRPHMARRGFASALKEAGADDLDIAQAGQWQDPRSVLPYVADEPARARATIAKIGGRIGGHGRKRRKTAT